MEILLPLLIALAILAVMVVALAFYAGRFRRVGPNQALVISGRQRLVPGRAGPVRVGYRIVTSGGTFVWPVIEHVDVISLETTRIPFDVIAHFQDGQQARFTGSAAIAVERSEDAIYLASARLQTKTPEDLAVLVGPILATEIRARVVTKTVDDIPRAPICFATDIAEAFNAHLPEFGLACLSLDLENAEPLSTLPGRSYQLATDDHPPHP